MYILVFLLIYLRFMHTQLSHMSKKPWEIKPYFVSQENYDQTRARDFKCPLCAENMTSLKEFTAHLRGHNEAKPTNDPADPTGTASFFFI